MTNNGNGQGGEASTQRFDQAAAGWEANPLRLALATALAAAIRRPLPADHAAMHALEYGCGTGLVCRACGPRPSTTWCRGCTT